MTTSAAVPAAPREPELSGQTVVVIGGSAGIGLETARRARAEGADVILTARDPSHLEQAAAELGAKRTAASNVSFWRYARASTMPARTSPHSIGASPW